MMTDEAVAAWMRWRYGLEDEDRAWDWWNIWTEGLGMTRQAHLSREGNAVYIFEPEAAEELLENVREKGILQL